MWLWLEPFVGGDCYHCNSYASTRLRMPLSYSKSLAVSLKWRVGYLPRLSSIEHFKVL